MTQSIKKLLNNFIRTEKKWQIQLLENWPDIIGNLHAKVTIEKIYNDTLILGVYDSCWMQELYLLSPILIKTINEKLDQPYIKQVRFKKTVPKKKINKNTTIKIEQPQKNIRLTTKEKQALEHIIDPILRAALKEFLIRCYREKK